jgi:translation initiation factor IF-3
VGEDGKQIGVIKTSEALAYAQERDLDLVEVAPDARPPVCRVLDYSKYKYEQAQKQKAARKHQQQITIREIKFRPKIAQNDYDTKKGHVERFLLHKDRVKVTIMFRGREVTHPERGTALLDKLAGELSELAIVEQHPIQDGRNMTMMLAPSKAVLAGEKDGKSEAAAPGGESGATAAESTSETPAADSTSETPAADSTSETPAAESASEAPASDGTADAPAAEGSTDAPAADGAVSPAPNGGQERQNGSSDASSPAPSDAAA